MIRLLTLLYVFILPFTTTAWELSLTVAGAVHLVNESNGSLKAVQIIQLDEESQESHVQPLVHDPVRNILYISGTIHENGTIIYQLNLTTNYLEEIFINDSTASQKTPGKILGLEHDYIKNMLYWSNGEGGKILKLDLNTDYKQKRELHNSEITIGGLALDECNQVLYWTSYNQSDSVGYIESKNLDGSGHRKLHQATVHRPMDITMDKEKRKLYWCDLREDKTFAIERSNLDGSSWEAIMQSSTGVTPISIALTTKYVFWVNHYTHKFERIEKDVRKKNLRKQDIIFDYESGTPMSIVSRKNILNCAYKNQELQTEPYIINSSPASEAKDSKERSNDRYIYNTVPTLCVNGGEQKINVPRTATQHTMCKCPPPFHGHFCEKCDFCIHGTCSLHGNGSVSCICDKGYQGHQCEENMCFQYCLNGGSCSVGNSSKPICNCSGNYKGSRCEIDCNLFCQNNPTSVILDTGKPLCLCGRNGLYAANMDNITLSQLAVQKHSKLEMQLGIGLITLAVLFLTCLIVIIFLAKTVMKLRKRPRIKKRIIVNKNITPTPLTCRPSPSAEQCEITIENCCNMNICETPCYEPQLRTSDKSLSKTEEKKNLLGNMEEGENGSPSQDSLY